MTKNEQLMYEYAKLSAQEVQTKEDIARMHTIEEELQMTGEAILRKAIASAITTLK